MSIDQDHDQEHRYSTFALDVHWSRGRPPDAELARHIETCIRCRAYLAALDDLRTSAAPSPIPAARPRDSVMLEPTYSVFVRFRRGQRLKLKLAAPLDVALRFASTVRSERFHNPDDVFIIDDLTGETVVESSITPSGGMETMVESSPVPDSHTSTFEQQGELETLHSYVSRWQSRHAQLTLRGGQRLGKAVERSLGQLIRLIEQLRRSNLLLERDVVQLLEEATRAIEPMRKVCEGLHQAEMTLPATTNDEEKPALAAQAAGSKKRGRRLRESKRPAPVRK